eukprot:SAG11_NODE_1521_length_4755_cov_4.896263_3_plen_78_part_00
MTLSNPLVNLETATARHRQLSAEANSNSQAQRASLNRLLARQKLIEDGYVADVNSHCKRFEEEAAGRLAIADAQRGA